MIINRYRVTLRNLNGSIVIIEGSATRSNPLTTPGNTINDQRVVKVLNLDTGHKQLDPRISGY